MYRAFDLFRAMHLFAASAGGWEALRGLSVALPGKTYGRVEKAISIGQVGDLASIAPWDGSPARTIWKTDLAGAVVLIPPGVMPDAAAVAAAALIWKGTEAGDAKRFLAGIAGVPPPKDSRVQTVRLTRVRPNQPDPLRAPSRRDLAEVCQIVLSELDRGNDFHSDEPFIQWIRVSENDSEKAFLVCRNYTPPVDVKPRHELGQWISYKAPLGRVASFAPGEEVVVDVPIGRRRFRVLERLSLCPARDGTRWDGRGMVYLPPPGGVAIPSLREYLKDDQPLEAPERRTATEFSLPDQAILDSIQDEAFRAPLSGIVLITGRAGVGKTTLMIRRLSLKTKKQFLRDSEPDLAIDSRALDELLDPKRAWLLCCPTAALKRFVANALEAEGVQGVQDHVRTWMEIRQALLTVVFPGIAGAAAEREHADSRPAIAPQWASWHGEFREHLRHSKVGEIAPEKVKQRLEELERRREMARKPSRPEERENQRERDRQFVRFQLLEEALATVPAAYRAFRSGRPLPGSTQIAAAGQVSLREPEVDIVLAESLRLARRELRPLAAAPASNAAGLPKTLGQILRSYRTVVAIDEATDFSPSELACIALLQNPYLGGVSMVGDLRQRIVRKGVRDWATVQAVADVGRMRILEVDRAYRQSSRLDQAAIMMTGTHSPGLAEEESSKRPSGSLRLFRGDRRSPDFGRWLKALMSTSGGVGAGKAVSTAVIVPSEADVGAVSTEIAGLLGPAAAVEKCPDGISKTKGGGVRIFSYEHVKGLEFEGVVFLDVDRLPEDLADQILYVGLTRARAFFAATHRGPLPGALAKVEGLFERTGAA